MRALDAVTSGRREHVLIGPAAQPGLLEMPAKVAGLVFLPHDSCSGLSDERCRRLAAVMNASGLATLTFELKDAPAAPANVDFALLGRQVQEALAWAKGEPKLSGLRAALFGSGSGAAAALDAAGQPTTRVAAVVSLGGRPDLAADRLDHVRAPTLLIVGGADPQALAFNQAAMRQLKCKRRLELVPGASERFDEPGALASVAAMATLWFTTHLTGAGNGT